jgi:oligoendopeptidase F
LLSFDDRQKGTQIMERIARKDIPEEQFWNSAALFSGWDEIRTEIKNLEAELSNLATFQGRFAEGADVVFDGLEVYQALLARVVKLYTYIGMATAVDTSDDTAKAIAGQIGGLAAKFSAAAAFAEPEMVAMVDRLLEWSDSEPNLAIYKHYFEHLKQQANHTRSTEVEEVLGMLGEPFSGAGRTSGELADVDLRREDIIDAAGNTKPHKQVAKIDSSERELRRQTWEKDADAYVAYQNTFASNYITSVQQNTLRAKVRRYDSVLQMRMEPTGLPVQVFHNLIDAFKANLGTWHKYWDVKRQILGVDELRPYDIWAPIVDKPPVIPFEQAVDWMGEAIRPLGDDYVATMRKGCLEDDWIDRAYNLEKANGAFSSLSVEGSPPYIMMSYDDTLLAMSTLAHELGHSMNLMMIGQQQPMIYNLANDMASDSVIETPSNFHQAMTRAYLREIKKDDEQFLIAMIDEAMSNFHRYFFYMPSIARFEYEVHRRVMEGEPLNASILNEIMGGFMAEGYGDTMGFNADYAGITWAQLSHVFHPFYTFQYAIGISAAYAIADDVLAGKAGAAENYLKFASVGTSVDALASFDVAGVNMRDREAIDKAFAVMADLVNQLETLAS